MEVEQVDLGGSGEPPPRPAAANRAVLAFGSVERLGDPALPARLRRAFPEAIVVGCSTAGEITGEGVSDGHLSVTSIRFDRTRLRAARASVESMSDSRAVGQSIGRQLLGRGLTYVLVLSDGVRVNGSALSSGLRETLPEEVLVTGGMAGDAGRFERTLILDGDDVSERTVVAVGFYGDRLRVGHGSVGGWEAFGPIRRATRSRDNVVYELDGRPALSVYERYLGEDAVHLPASGLLFPLALVSDDLEETGLIRTLLAVDRAEGSLTFAGNVGQGCLVRLMHANFEQLVDGAESAAGLALRSLRDRPSVALLISCVGRRLLMGARTDQELEAAKEVLGPDTPLCGFYSNGEISPFVPSARCELHNQTMTITAFSEDP